MDAEELRWLVFLSNLIEQIFPGSCAKAFGGCNKAIPSEVELYLLQKGDYLFLLDEQEIGILPRRTLVRCDALCSHRNERAAGYAKDTARVPGYEINLANFIFVVG